MTFGLLWWLAQNRNNQSASAQAGTGADKARPDGKFPVYSYKVNGSTLTLVNTGYVYSVNTVNGGPRSGLRQTSHNSVNSKDDFLYLTTSDDYAKYSNDYQFLSPMTNRNTSIANGDGSQSSLLYNKDTADSILTSNVPIPEGSTISYDPNYQEDGVTIPTYIIKGPDGEVLSYIPVTKKTVYDPYKKCFLKDTMILMQGGYVAVQDIKVGDKIVVVKNGKQELASVTMLKETPEAFVKTGVEEDYPVRILKNALAEGVPSQDLLVTPEHCLVFDGKLVPSRMLVNGCSVFYDKSFTKFGYYHIETEEHSVIIANNTLTETFLNPAKVRPAEEGSNVLQVQKFFVDEVENSTLELDVCRDFVEPIYKNIVERAVQNQIAAQEEAVALTQDSNLHLLTDKGQILSVARSAENRKMFMIPPGVGSVRIISRSSRPSDVIGPFVDDRRYLGVLIGDITLFDGKHSTSLMADLAERAVSGWHMTADSPCQWTDGDAVLVLPRENSQGIGLLSLDILAAGPYVLEQPEADKQYQALVG
ncbi:Hint domain-containing protein [Acetobacter cibinongensis]|uniref:Hint domain-containing protein n=1 Tax=Acetobacter cibinongensis TaxID=146475 RepID=UPI000A3789D9|nr:Hint domain-containing protein [Acetobacter cibinongensis]